MTKFLLTATLSFFLLTALAQEEKELIISARNDSKVLIEDQKELKIISSDSEETYTYNISVLATVLDNYRGTLKLNLSPENFVYTAKDKAGNIIYNSVEESFYKKQKTRLEGISFLVDFDTTAKDKKGPVLGKGAGDLISFLKSMVSEENKEKLDLLITEDYLVELCKQLIPFDEGTIFSPSAELGYEQKKNVSDKLHVTTSELSLKPKQIERSYAFLTSIKNNSESITDPSSGRLTEVVTSESGNMKISFKSGFLMMSSLDSTTEISTTKDKEIIEEKTHLMKQTISVGNAR